MEKKAKTKQQLLLEMEELRTRLDAAEQRLKGANEALQAQMAEHKRAEEALEKTQQYARSIVETIREPLVVLSPDLHVISANQSFYQTFKVAPEETEGRFIYSVGNHQWDIPALRKLLEEIIPKNTHFNDFKVDHAFPAIGQRTMLLNARRIYRERKGTEMILLAIEDITERKQAEEALKVSETRYRRLFETAQDGILILDADTGEISDVNPFLIEMLGYAHDHFLGKKLWEIGAFKDVEASKTAFSELQNKGYVRYEDLPLETRDGRHIDVEFVSNVYLVNHKKVIQCNIRDITQRKWAEKEVHERERRYRSYIEVTGQLGWATNADGEIVEDIPAWRKFTGQSEEEVKGQGWTKALHPEDAGHTKEAWNKAIATKSPFEIEYRLRREDGIYRHLLARGVPVLNEDGSIREWVGTCIDITERKQIEDAQMFLVQCGLPASGEDFFESLARYLAENLGMDYVCIDRLQEEGLAAQTVAIYFDGKIEDNLIYTLKDTPCGDVVGKTICCFPKGVRHLYPQDVVLQEMMAESYVGTTLWSSKGQPIGLIAIIGRKPLANPNMAESILKLAAVRAAGELERRWAEEALRKKTYELGERVKELNCLYAFSKLVERPNISLPEIYQGLVDLIPSGWRYPEVTCVRLLLGDRIFKTANCRETLWKQSSPIWVGGERKGDLEVYYLEEKPKNDDGPFLKEERDLLNSLAGRLGNTIERLNAEEALRKAHDELERRVEERTADLRRINEQLEQEIEGRKQIEKILQLERNKLKSILETMNNGVYIVNQNYDIQYVNPALEKEFGPVNGQKCHEYFHDLPKVCSWCKNQEVFAGKSVQWEWFSIKTGKTYDLFDTPILNEDGTIAKLEIFHDITDHKRAEALLRQSEKQLRSLSSRLLAAQETERRRVSRELHDELGGSLIGLKLRLNFIKKNLQNQEELRRECEESLQRVDQIIEDVHRLSLDLSPSLLEDLGLTAAIRWQIDNFVKNHRTKIASDIVDIDHLFPKDAQVMTYRILQEALTNIGKHAEAKNVSVKVKKEDNRISFLIEDDGKGFDVTKVLTREATEKGLGLAAMEERARMLGGSFDLWSQEGKGARLTLTIPIKKEGNLE